MASDRRLHPASILFDLALHLRQLVLPGIAVLFTAGARGGEWQVWLMLLFIPYAAASVWRYAFYRYEFTPGELVIRTGVLFRNERRVPYTRIQNVDATQTMWHRIFDVMSVRIETAAAAEPEAVMNVVSRGALDEIRGHAFSGAGRASPGVPDALQARTVLHLPVRELAVYGLLEGRGLLVVLTAFGLLWETGLLDHAARFVFGDQASGRGAIRQLARAAVGLGSAPPGRILFTITAFALVLLAIRLLSAVWGIVKLHGFTLTLAGDDLRTHYGLLTRVAATIPRRRIQTVVVEEGPLHRLTGRVTVRVDTAGSDEGQTATEQRLLAPLLRADRVHDLFATALPDLDLSGVAWQRVHPRAFRRAFFQASVAMFAFAGLLALVVGWRTVYGVPLLLMWAALDGWLTVRRMGWAATHDAVLFRRGWLRRRSWIAPIGKIQAVALRESPFDRRLSMASIVVDTASGPSVTGGIRIPYLGRDTADQLASRLSAGAARVAFRW